MQKSFSLPFFFLLLIMSFTISAQSQSNEIPAIAYTLDNTLHVYYPGMGSSLVVTGQASESFLPFYRAAWSTDGAWLSYLVSNPNKANRPTLYVNNLKGEVIPVTTGDFATPFYPTWLPDGRILFSVYTGERRELIAVLNAYAVAPQENAEPELLGRFEISEGCGGGTNEPAMSDYFHETSLGGYREVFSLTPFGLIHDGQCVAAEVTLTNLATGESVRLAGGGFMKAVVSPSGSKVVGLKNGELTIVNLAEMSVTTVATTAIPDQFVWQGENSLIYSNFVETGDLLEAYDAEQVSRIEAAMGYIPEALPRHSVSIYVLDLTTGTDKLLYSADAFAIGRMAVRDNWLIFSQVENAERWVAAMADGSVTFENNFSASQDLVYTQVFALNLENLERIMLLEDAQQIVVAP